MSLRTALLDLAERMDADLIQYKNDLPPIAEVLLRSYSRELRTALASTQASPEDKEEVAVGLFAGDEAYHRMQIEKARQEFHREFNNNSPGRLFTASPRPPVWEEPSDEDIPTIAVGGPDDGVMISVPQSMAIGGQMVIDGATYRLGPDHRLHHVSS